MSDNLLVIKQKRSLIGSPKRTHLLMKGLGLSKIGRVVERKDTPAVRGIVEKVQHLVEVEVRKAS